MPKKSKKYSIRGDIDFLAGYHAAFMKPSYQEESEAQELDVTANNKPLIGNRGRHRHDVPDSPLRERAQKWIVHHELELLHGPAQVSFENDELVVLVVVRDGRSYIKSFVEHYFTLGAKHLVFLDNGSEDGTIEALKEYESGVTVFSTGLPFKQYQISMRQYLVERFGRGRWTLSVDIDELFDYPFSDVVSVKALLQYLNDNRYTAVIAQMLDMFPEAISSEVVAVSSETPLKKLHRYYDTSDVTTREYNLFQDLTGNEASNEEIKVLQGGVQRRLFNLSPMLTKHPLVFLEEGVRPVDLSEHWVGGARLADFSGVLLHYKLSADLYGLARREVEKRTYPNRHGKYDKYVEILESASQLLLKDETSRQLQSTDELLGTQFMVLSEKYMKFVDQEYRRKGGAPEAHTQRVFEAFLRVSSEAQSQAGEANRLRKERDKLQKERDNLRDTRDNLQKEKDNLRDTRDNLRKTRDTLQKEKVDLQNTRDKLRSTRDKAENRRKRAQQQADSLREQLAVIQSSRAWRVLSVLSRGKMAATDAGAVSRHQRMGDGRGPLPEARTAQPSDRKPVKDSTRPPERQDLEPQTSEAQTLEAKPMEDSPVFFIVGSGKSGTRWITGLLNAHPEVLCKGEGRFFNREWHREDLRAMEARVPPRTLFGALSNSEDLRLWMERSVWGRGEDTEELLTGMTRASIDYFLKRKLAKSGKRLVGDKTPFLPGVNLIKEIKEIYPEAKVIHIIRDGRDVEVSWVHHKWRRSADQDGAQVLKPAEVERRDAYFSSPQKITEIGMFDQAELRRRAGLWSETVGGATKDGPELLGDNYTEVKYESLLADTAKELKRLLIFLGAESSDDTVRRCVEKVSFERLSGGRQRGEEDPSAALRKGIAGDWKNVFTEEDRRIFKEEAGDLLVKLGYEKDNDW